MVDGRGFFATLRMTGVLAADFDDYKEEKHERECGEETAHYILSISRSTEWDCFLEYVAKYSVKRIAGRVSNAEDIRNCYEFTGVAVGGNIGI